jgi:hypothetical protein
MVIRMNAMTPVPNAEAASSGGSEALSEIAKARALVERLGSTGRRTTAEVLEELRRAFPHSPLAVRVRALEALRSR